MRGSLQFWDEAMYVHTDKELTKRPRITYHALECGCSDDIARPGYVTELLKISGIISIQLEKHKIIIYKGRVFEWQELIFHILDRVIFGLEGPLGKINFMAAPIKSWEDPVTRLVHSVVSDIIIPNPYHYNLQVREKNRKKNPPQEE